MASLVNKTNNQYPKNKLLAYSKPLTGCGSLRGGNKNLSTASYGYVSGDNNNLYGNSYAPIQSTSKQLGCKLTGGKKRKGKSKKRKNSRHRKKSNKKRYQKSNKKKSERSKKKKRRTIKKRGKQLLKKWIQQIKKHKRRSMKGGASASHYVYQTPGPMSSVSKGGMLANPVSYSVSNNCKDNYNHYKQN